MNKDYSLRSGERQVGTDMGSIRRDHINRYMCAIDYANNENIDIRETLDCFCGNGYGTLLLSERLDSNVLGIDGSLDAIKLATHYYNNDTIEYNQSLFPFEISENKYDLVTSIESVEHIDDYLAFLDALIGSAKQNGLIFISVPNINKISLSKNPNPFHFRHFDPDELTTLILEKYNVKLLDMFGQDVYDIDDRGIILKNLQPSEMGVVKNYDGQFTMSMFLKL